jgi:hypothetical protein
MRTRVFQFVAEGEPPAWPSARSLRAIGSHHDWSTALGRSASKLAASMISPDTPLASAKRLSNGRADEVCCRVPRGVCPMSSMLVPSLSRPSVGGTVSSRASTFAGPKGAPPSPRQRSLVPPSRRPVRLPMGRCPGKASLSRHPVAGLNDVWVGLRKRFRSRRSKLALIGTSAERQPILSFVAA